MTVDEGVDFCPGCGHGIAVCNCFFDCTCGCLYGAHSSGGPCEDCPCERFTEDQS